MHFVTDLRTAADISRTSRQCIGHEQRGGRNQSAVDNSDVVCDVLPTKAVAGPLLDSDKSIVPDNRGDRQCHWQ